MRDHIKPILWELHWPPRVCQVQSGMSGSPVAVRAGISLLGRWLLPRVQQHSALSAVSWRSVLHGAVTATELLQPLDLACGTLFCSSYAIQTSPTDCSDDNWRDTFFGKHERGALWLLICGAYLLTCLCWVGHYKHYSVHYSANYTLCLSKKCANLSFSLCLSNTKQFL